MTNISSFRDFLSLVIVHAPDEFPEEDYFEPHEQLNLESAFQELQRGVDLLAKSGMRSSSVAELANLLDTSLLAYRTGNDVKGAHLLQELESHAFGSPSAP
ncbi:hypothetical protein LVB77_04470 [Lysobacter sp. 5GHs7-4]|uniref:hypothetical protein n=1 Tax=Lysobacter sp. 5GHs7-4 TaxID=2904253 RepID=UPI001E4D87BD|nr:hypothetical protein [Lysobacter sp. 5GHs7-4]UHQ23976.1 hypothetical protein LVB77_04470 [Lysobacter sp. 5GHs7-4]